MNTAFDLPSARKARIEIIPLIDVIFFLLATFVLFTLSLEKIASIETVLPKPDPNPTPPLVDTMLYLQASEQGTYYWKIGKEAPAELVLRDALRPKLDDYARSARPRVFVRSDRSAKFGEAVFALDQVRAAGIKEVSVETMASATGR